VCVCQGMSALLDTRMGEVRRHDEVYRTGAFLVQDHRHSKRALLLSLELEIRFTSLLSEGAAP